MCEQVSCNTNIICLPDDKTGDIVVGPVPVVSLQHGNSDEKME